jgi:PIN domain nuclease of toxin-antitoxin system
VIHLDTHVLVWLYIGELGRLSAATRELLESEELRISPMVELELAYLHEVGRLLVPGGAVVDQLRPALGIQSATSAFSSVVHQAMTLTWTRDPFDRLIGAHALSDGARLLTADATLLEHLPAAIWPD